MTHRDYHIGSFTDVDDRWGSQLWELLNEPETIRTMTRASDEGQTAAEAIAQLLVDRLGMQRNQNRVKQFTGHLIKQVMERRGYRHVGDRRCTLNPLFTSAARYTHTVEA
jgi:hypothetical protein